jgi:two-component system phosphate regulon sensor histidine kinase PhoR
VELQGLLDQARETFQELKEGVVILDRDLRVTELNPAAARILGLDEPAAGRPLLEAVRQPELEAIARQALEQEEPGEREIEILLAEKGRRIVRVHSVRSMAPSGPVVVTLLEDLTELRRLETIRRDFVTAISHELRTPLTAIRGYTETLATVCVSDEQRDRFLSVILRNTERLERLLEDLLLLSRAESGGLELNVTPIRVGELAREMMRELEVRFEQGKLSVEVDEDPAPTEVLADHRALEHVLLNLLDNAIKYTPPGGSITVRIGADERRAYLQIADTGVGIPSKDLGRIFERFYRVERARPRDVLSTGLGLAIVKHLTEQMGGTVGVESEVGRGSTFTVRLPTP